MATQDLGNSPFAYHKSPIASPRTRGTPKIPKTSLCNLESTCAEVSENSPFAYHESPIASPRTRATPKTPLCNLESTYAELSENSNSEDTTDASNVTVIRVERCISSRSEASPKFEG